MKNGQDFGLDLAVIGNGQTAALLESRLLWWCHPRFDGDPVLRLSRSWEDQSWRG